MAKTGLPNFALKITSPWKGTQHVWRLVSSHSGSHFTTQAQALSFLISVWDAVSVFISAEQAGYTYVSGWAYYNGTTSAALWEVDYSDSALSVTAGFVQSFYGEGYTSSVAGAAGLECCTVLQAPVGVSSTGKPVFLKKFIHGVPATTVTAAPDTVPVSSGGIASALLLGSGGLYDSRVLTSPGGKQGIWVVAPYFGNHQMPRRRKKKTAGVSLTAAEVSALLGSASLA